MKPNLIFIAGAPGVGKSTVARHLLDRLEDAVWLDGDDVWRMSPFRVDDATTAMVERNIVAVLREFLRGGYRNVILSWVLHRQDLIDRITGHLADTEYCFICFALTCDKTELSARLGDDVSEERMRFIMQRQRQVCETGATLVDSTNRSAVEIAEEISSLVSKAERTV